MRTDHAGADPGYYLLNARSTASSSIPFRMFLNCHSWFSFKHGVMKPDALLQEAARAGVRTLALTDIHNTAGIPDFVRDAGRYDVRPVAGIEFKQGSRSLYIGLAKNNEGFQRLNELLSPHLLDGEALPERAPG